MMRGVSGWYRRSHLVSVGMAIALILSIFDDRFLDDDRL